MALAVNSPLLALSCCRWPRRWLRTSCKRRASDQQTSKPIRGCKQPRGIARSLRKFLESRQFYCTSAHGLRACADAGSIRPPSLRGTEVTLQAAGEARQRGRVGLCQRHFLLLYLPIVEFEVRALRAQQRRQEGDGEISQLTDAQIHRHGVTRRIHAGHDFLFFFFFAVRPQTHRSHEHRRETHIHERNRRYVRWSSCAYRSF